MMRFFDFYNKLNGEPYAGEEESSPATPTFQDYCKQVSGGENFNGPEDGTWALKPLTGDDFARASHDDVVDHLVNNNKNGNPN